MSDNDKTRSTSFAKTVDLDYEKNSLDRVAPLHEQFARATEAPAQQQVEEKTRQSDEKTIAHAPRPELHLRPTGITRKPVDKQIDKERLSALAVRALELNKSALQRSGQKKTLDLNKDWHKAKHHGR